MRLPTVLEACTFSERDLEVVCQVFPVVHQMLANGVLRIDVAIMRVVVPRCRSDNSAAMGAEALSALPLDLLLISEKPAHLPREISPGIGAYEDLTRLASAFQP